MLTTCKRCTLKVRHEPFYPRNTCGATFFACFPQCFNAFSMRIQHELFYQHNLCKKNTNPSILPSSRCCPKTKVQAEERTEDSRPLPLQPLPALPAALHQVCPNLCPHLGMHAGFSPGSSCSALARPARTSYRHGRPSLVTPRPLLPMPLSDSSASLVSTGPGLLSFLFSTTYIFLLRRSFAILSSSPLLASARESTFEMTVRVSWRV